MRTLYFCPVVSFFFFSLPNLSGRRLDVYHTSTHGVALVRSVQEFGAPQHISLVSCLAFVTAVTSLTGGQPNFARCLAVSWAGTPYIFFRRLLPVTEFCLVQNSLYVQVLRSTLEALLHGIPAAGVSQTLCMAQGMELQNFRRGRHLYSEGRPSRWASAHILV